MSALPRQSWWTGQAAPRPAFATEETYRYNRLQRLPAPWPSTARAVEATIPSMAGSGILTPFIEAQGLAPVQDIGADFFRDMDDDDLLGVTDNTSSTPANERRDQVVGHLGGADSASQWLEGIAPFMPAKSAPMLDRLRKDARDLEYRFAASSAYLNDPENPAWADNRWVSSRIGTGQTDSPKTWSDPAHQAALRSGFKKNAAAALARTANAWPDDMLTVASDPGVAHVQALTDAGLWPEIDEAANDAQNGRYPYGNVVSNFSEYPDYEPGPLLTPEQDAINAYVRSKTDPALYAAMGISLVNYNDARPKLRDYQRLAQGLDPMYIAAKNAEQGGVNAIPLGHDLMDVMALRLGLRSKDPDVVAQARVQLADKMRQAATPPDAYGTLYHKAKMAKESIAEAFPLDPRLHQRNLRGGVAPLLTEELVGKIAERILRTATPMNIIDALDIGSTLIGGVHKPLVDAFGQARASGLSIDQALESALRARRAGSTGDEAGELISKALIKGMKESTKRLPK